MSRDKVELTAYQKRNLYAAVALLWLTGGLWLLFPNLSAAMKIHGAVAMIFLVLFGTLLQQHVRLGWKRGEQRMSGGYLIAVLVILILTGWGLYYSGSDEVRSFISKLHWIVGLALPGVIGIHVWMGRRIPPS